MDTFDLIETPEHVELEQPLAGIGSRFLAGLLDNLILAAVFLVLFIVLSLLVQLSPFEDTGAWAFAFLILIGFVIQWGYFVFFELRTNGQSPGKKATKIRVVKEGGTPITFSDVAVRNLLRAIDALPFYAIAGVTMFISKKCQRLGDLAAGTVVVSEQVSDFSARTDRRVRADWQAQAGAPALRATGLTPEEYRVVNNYWMRRGQLTLDARRSLLPRLLRPILIRTGQTLSDDRLETLEAYVELLMRQAWFAQTDAENATAQREGGP